MGWWVWEEVTQAWEAAGQQMGEAREGIARGRGEWRVRVEAVTKAIVQWLESNGRRRTGRSSSNKMVMYHISGKPEPGVTSSNGGGYPGFHYLGGRFCKQMQSRAANPA
jgi:hypothetical protein